MPDNETKTKSFLQDELNLRGWSGGGPTYKEEEQFILDYLDKYGVAPTPQQVGDWVSGQNRTDWSFTPYSTMGKMGFSTLADYGWAQQHGTSYGPYAGSYVPEGGTVVTDEKGRPVGRFMDKNNPLALKYTAGKYYIPTLGEAEQALRDAGFGNDVLPGLKNDTAKYYRTVEPWKNPTVEEALGKYSPQQVYRAKYEDYLNEKLSADSKQMDELANKWDNLESEKTDKINQLKDSYMKGEISKDELDKQSYWIERTTQQNQDALDKQGNQLLTSAKMKQLLSDADAMIGRGELDNLPMMKELANVMGSETNKLYNNMINEMKQNYIKNLPPIYQKGSEMQPPSDMKAPGIAKPNQLEFLSYVDNLKVAEIYKNYLKNNYTDFVALWQESGMTKSFIIWLKEYLRGG